MKQKSFDKILFHNYMYLIIITALLISVFSAFIDAKNTLLNEKQNMYESLRQAQININNHTQMIDYYLTLTHSNADIQTNLKALLSNPRTTLLTQINNNLFSTDLFKKNLDSIQIFAYETQNFLPVFSPSTQYSNALFSAGSVDSTNWFQDTLLAEGHTYWFIDTVNFQKPTLCASRVLYDVTNVSKPLGVIKANVSINKLIKHLGDISFGEKGYALIWADGQLFHPDSNISDYILNNLAFDKTRLSMTHLLVEFPIITTDWKVVGIMSNWELYRNTLENLLLIALVSALSILLAGFLSTKNSKKISSPIIHLCSYMSDMTETNHNEVYNCIEINQLYATYHSMLTKNKTLIKSREETLLKFKQAEMAALHSQMNPHFIYNTLESVNALISIADTKNASLMVTSLGQFLRSSLNNGNNFITLKKEIEQVSSYIQIQKLRYSNSIELILNVPDPLPENRIIKLILQPLVENSIMHGFKDFMDTGYITISVWETDTDLCISVDDNGWGSDIEMLNYLVRQKTLYKEDNINFYCIQNVYQRLCNCYGKDCCFTYAESKSGGVTANIQISKKVL